MRSGDYARWKAHSAMMRHKLGLAADAKPWTGRRGVTCGGYRLTERQADVLDVAWASRRSMMPENTTSDQLRENWWANLSQAVQRKPWSEVVHTTCRSGIEYSFQADTILTGFAQMQILGHPQNFANSEDFSSRELYELAGEGYSIPICSLFLHAFFCNPHAPWW